MKTVAILLPTTTTTTITTTATATERYNFCFHRRGESQKGRIFGRVTPREITPRKREGCELSEERKGKNAGEKVEGEAD